jgi:hypothetical protein
MLISYTTIATRAIVHAARIPSKRTIYRQRPSNFTFLYAIQKLLYE